MANGAFSKNPAGYSDPTAERAIGNVERRRKMEKKGKRRGIRYGKA